MLDQHDGHPSAASPGNQAGDHGQGLVPIILESLGQTLLNVDDDQSRRVAHDWVFLSVPMCAQPKYAACARRPDAGPARATATSPFPNEGEGAASRISSALLRGCFTNQGVLRNPQPLIPPTS